MASSRLIPLSAALAMLMIAAVLSVVLIESPDGPKPMGAEQPCVEETQEPEASPSPTPTPPDTGAHIIVIKGTGDKSGPSKLDIVTIAVSFVTTIALVAAGVLGYGQLRQEMKSADQTAALERDQLTNKILENERKAKAAAAQRDRQQRFDLLDYYVREAESAAERGDHNKSDTIRNEYEEKLVEYRGALFLLKSIGDAVPRGRISPL